MKITRVETYTVVVPLHEGSWHSKEFVPEGYDYGGQWVRLQVIDEGPGFAEAILQRAFEPYVTTKPKGTGLGLAVVKKIMDEHGGRVELLNRRDGDRTLGAQVSLSFRVANMQQIPQGAPTNG